MSHQEAYEFLALSPVTHEKIIPREVIAKVFGGHPVKAAHESFQPAVIRVDTLDAIFLSIPVCGPSIRLHLDQADLTVSGKTPIGFFIIRAECRLRRYDAVKYS